MGSTPDRQDRLPRRGLYTHRPSHLPSGRSSGSPSGGLPVCPNILTGRSWWTVPATANAGPPAWRWPLLLIRSPSTALMWWAFTRVPGAGQAHAATPPAAPVPRRRSHLGRVVLPPRPAPKQIAPVALGTVRARRSGGPLPQRCDGPREGRARRRPHHPRRPHPPRRQSAPVGAPAPARSPSTMWATLAPPWASRRATINRPSPTLPLPLPRLPRRRRIALAVGGVS